MTLEQAMDMMSRLGHRIKQQRRRSSVLPNNEMMVLLMLCHQPSERAFIGDLQQELCLSKSAISQLLSSLEQKEYLTRAIAPDDRRRILLAVTQKGHEALEREREVGMQYFTELLGRLGDEEAQRLFEIICKINTIAEELAAESQEESN